MSEALTYVSAEDLLGAAKKAHPNVDIDLGGAYIRVRLAPSYDEMLSLDQRRREMVSTIRSEGCPKELKRFRQLSDDAISTAGLLAFTSEKPALTMEQALELMGDGLTVKVILNAIQRAGVAHLVETATERINQGKDESAKTPTTD